MSDASSAMDRGAAGHLVDDSPQACEVKRKPCDFPEQDDSCRVPNSCDTAEGEETAIANEAPHATTEIAHPEVTDDYTCGTLWKMNQVPVVSAIDRESDEGERPYRSAIFRATHNSYSGGSRRSIEEQLDSGVRFIEFDIHAAGFGESGDFSLGHNAPGQEVSHEGTNPESNRLSEWLQLIARWSSLHQLHAPITIGLDMKDNLSDAASAARGNVGALNEIIEKYLGDVLVRPSEFEMDGRLASGPTVNQLRGRILVVLSGDVDSRSFYRWDVGNRPAVAMNASGWIVEVHDSGTGTLGSLFPRFQYLWYWTGRRMQDGRIKWLRHGKYDSGIDPAIAINNSNDIVEVHKSGSKDTLWCHYGKLDEHGEIAWSPAIKYDTGVSPTVAFTNLDSTNVREIHSSENQSNEFWTWRGNIDVKRQVISWSEHGRTSDAPFSKESTQSAGIMLTVSASASPNTVPVPGTLRYTTSDGRQGRIRHEQIAFIEYQQNNATALIDDGIFFHAGKAGAREWITLQRHAGYSVRQWGFNSIAHAVTPPANFPATDHPFEQWYRSYMDSIGAVE